MSIIKKLDNLMERQLFLQATVTKEEMKEIFGEKYKENIFKTEISDRTILFEEDDKLYFSKLSIHPIYKDYILTLFLHNVKFYSEVSEQDVKELLEAAAFYEKQMKCINKILSHKKFKVKKLFL